MSRSLVAVLLVVVAGCSKGTTTSAPAAPAQWGVEELADHLNSKGVKVTVVPLPLAQAPVQAVLLKGEEPTDPSVVVFYYPDGKGVAAQVAEMGEGAFAFERFAIGLPRPKPSDADRALHKRIADALK